MVRFAFYSVSAKERRRREYLNDVHGYDFDYCDDLGEHDNLPETPYDSFPAAPDEWTQIGRSRGGDFHAYDPQSPPLPAVGRTHRDGLVFENELHDMTRATRPLVRAHFDADAILEEVAYGTDWYRTDLVACCIDERLLQKRYRILGHDGTIGEPVRYAKAFHRLAERSAMPKETFIYENGAGYAESTARDCWSHLHEQQFIATTPRGFAAAVNLPDPVTAHAIELKPNDWREALEQAERADGTGLSTWYSSKSPGYADYRWVALDAGGHGIDDALAHRDAFRDAGVGLLAVDRGGLVEFVAADKCDPPSGLDRLLVSERAIARADLDAETPDPSPRLKAFSDEDDSAAEQSDDQLSLTSF